MAGSQGRSLYKVTPQIQVDSSGMLWHRHTGLPLTTSSSSATIAEAGDLSGMSHRPKVPSTLKLLEGIEVSLLFSLELLNFLLLPSIKLFVPVVQHGVHPGQSAVFDGVLTDG